MRIRRFCFVLALLLFPTGARADRHYLEVSASGYHATGSSLWGGNLAITKVVPVNFLPKKDRRRFSTFIEYSKHAGPHDGGVLTEWSGLGGARYVVFRTIKYKVSTPKEEFHFRLQFFIEGLSGLIHTADRSEFGKGFGGGFDVLFSDYGGVRAQLDHLSFGDDPSRKGFTRYGLGVVYRFE